MQFLIASYIQKTNNQKKHKKKNTVHTSFSTQTELQLVTADESRWVLQMGSCWRQQILCPSKFSTFNWCESQSIAQWWNTTWIADFLFFQGLPTFITNELKQDMTHLIFFTFQRLHGVPLTLGGSVVEHWLSSAKGCGFNSQGTRILTKMYSLNAL